MAEELPEAIIHTLDLPLDYLERPDPVSLRKDDMHLVRRRQVGHEFIGQACSLNIIQHWGDSATWDFRQAAGATFFFIDGSHTYEYVMNDSEKCFRLCDGLGTFVWHDAGHPPIVKFLKEWADMGCDIKFVPGTMLAYWRSNV